MGVVVSGWYIVCSNTTIVYGAHALEGILGQMLEQYKYAGTHGSPCKESPEYLPSICPNPQ